MSVYLLWVDALDPQLRSGNPFLFGIYATLEAAKLAIPNASSYYYYVTRRAVKP